MQPPKIVTPPNAAIMTLKEMKDHLNVDSDDDEAEIEQLMAAVVAGLDGWSGSLGRCIMPQTWSIELDRGRSILPFPDVLEARVGGDVIGLELTSLGSAVRLTSKALVEFDCALSDADLQRAKLIVKLMVKSIYDQEPIPDAYHVFCSGLKWVNV